MTRRGRIERNISKAAGANKQCLTAGKKKHPAYFLNPGKASLYFTETNRITMMTEIEMIRL